MSKKRAPVTTYNGFTFIAKSGFDFVAFNATPNGASVVNAFQAYADNRAELGAIDLAYRAEMARISADYSARRAEITATKARAIADGCNKDDAERIADAERATAKDARDNRADALKTARATASASVERSNAFRANLSQVGKMIDTNGHDIATLTDVARAYFKAFGINFSDDTLTAIATFLNGADVRRATNADYAENGATLTNQRGSYLARLMCDLFAHTLERVHVIAPNVPSYSVITNNNEYEFIKG